MWRCELNSCTSGDIIITSVDERPPSFLLVFFGPASLHSLRSISVNPFEFFYKSHILILHKITQNACGILKTNAKLSPLHLLFTDWSHSRNLEVRTSPPEFLHGGKLFSSHHKNKTTRVVHSTWLGKIRGK